MRVPFLDLKSVNRNVEGLLEDAFRRVVNSGWYIQGKELEAFESEFAEYCKVEHCVGVGNGLDAIHLLLAAYGVGPGDEVIVPSNTFIATWLAVTRCGATPVAAEPNPDSFNIDPQAIEAAITPRTVAIIPVHLFGQPADMDAINSIASRHKLLVIEDAAQSQGAQYRGRPSGSLGNAAATSFYPGKNLGALGDGGAVMTSDSAIARKVKQLRNYGSPVKYQHDSLGYNSRLDELQAAFLRIKLRELDSVNARRREIAQCYTEALAASEIRPPHVPTWADPVWHLYVVRTARRDQLQEHLKLNGVETMVHYPIPPHRQKCYADTLSDNAQPIAEKLAGEILSLPISPSMTNAQVQHVIDQLRAF
jgi:dTDP-4-amino-4,6-dideoxygalactose transaminase